MKTSKTTITLIAVMLLMNVMAFAQTKTDTKKEIIIETITIDKNGKEVKEKIKLEGKEAEEYMKKHHGEMGDHHFDIRIEKDGDIDIDKNIEIDEDIHIIKTEDGESFKIKIDGLHEDMEHSSSVNINDDNGKITIEIKKDGMESFRWEGEGEIPEDIKQQIKEKYDIDVDSSHGGEGTEIERMIRVERSNSSNKAQLGVMLQQEEGQGGVNIDAIIEGSPAEKAGLKKGDIITKINGNTTENIEQVIEEIGKYEVGDNISITYRRNENDQTVNATLAANKSQGREFRKFKITNDGLMNLDFKNGDIKILMDEDEDGNKMIKKKKMIIIQKRIEDDPEENGNAQNLNIKPDTNSKLLELPEFNVYPNPSKGSISLDFSAKALPTTISITDITGKEVYREELNNFDGNYKKQLELNNAATGAMLLSIQQGEKVFTRKLINQ